MSARKLDAVDERYRPCMGCSRERIAAQEGIEWPCEAHDTGSTVADMEQEREARAIEREGVKR